MSDMSKEELLEFIASHSREELWERAHAAKEAETPKVFDFCAILSARQGKCPEDCKWCAQSAHWKTACAWENIHSKRKKIANGKCS